MNIPIDESILTNAQNEIRQLRNLNGLLNAKLDGFCMAYEMVTAKPKEMLQQCQAIDVVWEIERVLQACKQEREEHDN